MHYILAKLETPLIEGLDDMDLTLDKVMGNILKDIQNKHDEILETALRTMAEPPIKGEITKGKIRWRGIRLCTQNDGLKSYTWLEQRGRLISPTITIEGIILPR